MNLTFYFRIPYIRSRIPVYPGAVHTRFQHSLGTMALADQIARKLNTKYPAEVTFAALLHDIGHFPLSHSFEDFFQDRFHVNHEETGREIILGKKGTGEIREYLESNDIDPEVVTRILSVYFLYSCLCL